MYSHHSSIWHNLATLLCVLYAMSTQFCTTSLQRVWSLISHSRICEHDLTVTLTLLCTCTHCVNVTVCIEDQSNGDKHDVCTSYGTCGYHIHTHTHTPSQTLYLSNDGAHYTHIQTHVHCMQGVNLFSAHTLAFSSIELPVCIFKLTMILFSISVWDYIHASCNMRLTTPCETMLSQFFKPS